VVLKSERPDTFLFDDLLDKLFPETQHPKTSVRGRKNKPCRSAGVDQRIQEVLFYNINLVFYNQLRV
jgi:hypothetical protein